MLIPCHVPRNLFHAPSILWALALVHTTIYLLGSVILNIGVVLSKCLNLSKLS